MHLEIDETLCSGCGQCVMEAPELFDQRDEDGVAFLLRQPESSTDEADATRAKAACPADAIVSGE